MSGDTDRIPILTPDTAADARRFGAGYGYLVGFSSRQIADLVNGEHDHAFGRPGEVSGVSLLVKRRSRMTWYRPDAWGIKHANADTLERIIQELRSACYDAGIKWAPTASTVAGRLLRRFLPRLRQLPHRWRGMAHAAIMAGPITHVRGGADLAAYLDIQGAYLWAAGQELPAHGLGAQWRMVDRPKLQHLHRYYGLCHCDVEVHGLAHTDELPLLPITAKSRRVMHPIGRFCGVWPTTVLRWGIERGEITVRRIRRLAICATKRLLRPLADFLAGVPKPIGGPIYRTLWGKTVTRGGYRGYRGATTGLRADGLVWQWTGKPWHAMLPPTYRPDIGGAIASHNYLNVIAAARTLETGSLIATHVDSILTSDIAGALRLHRPGTLGAFEIETMGRARMYAAGRYYIEGSARGTDSADIDACDTWPDRIRCAGHPNARNLTTLTLENWAQESAPNRHLPKGIREWSLDPRWAQDAGSNAVGLIGDTAYQIQGWDPLDPDAWDRAGWIRRELRDPATIPDKPDLSL